MAIYRAIRSIQSVKDGWLEEEEGERNHSNQQTNKHEPRPSKQQQEAERGESLKLNTLWVAYVGK